MFTFQDFEREKRGGLGGAVAKAIQEHKGSRSYLTALDANRYDRQMNTTIMSYSRWLYSESGARVPDNYGSNNRLCSNFFRRLNTQRVTYSLGNGFTFETDGLKEQFGKDFDTRMKTAGYDALIHGVSFIFWNIDHIHVFPCTEFAPLWDEETGALRAGIRYWQIDDNKPGMAVLYEEDGYTRFKSAEGFSELKTDQPKKAYKVTYESTYGRQEEEVVGEENYSGRLPIIPLFGSNLHQSTLVGMKSKIDAYDLVASGFANDMQDCAEIYWIVNNAGGMQSEDLARFRERLKLTHIANVEDADEVSVTPYTQDVPTAARQAFLAEVRNSLYEDFGALDVHAVAAGATNDHIDAAYQPMDENADDFEYQVIDAVQQLLALIGVEDTPVFKRNRISNQKEQVDMIMTAAQYLDQETILAKLPFLTPDEIDGILDRKAEEDAERFAQEQKNNNNAFDEEDEDEENIDEE